MVTSTPEETRTFFEELCEKSQALPYQSYRRPIEEYLRVNEPVDEVLRVQLKVLAHVLRLHIRPGESPALIGYPRNMDDFTAEDLHLLIGIVSHLPWDVQGIVYDLLWCRMPTDKGLYAERAITAYCEAAKEFSYRREDAGHASTRIERSLDIASMTRDELAKERVRGAAIQFLNDQSQATWPLKGRMLSCLTSRRLISEQESIELIEAMLATKETESGTDFGQDTLQNLLELKAKLLAELGKTQEAQACLIERAESYLKQAALFELDTFQSISMRIHLLEKAVEAFRTIGGQKERRDKVHKALLEAQENLPSHYVEVAVPAPDLSHSELAAIEAVSSRSWHDALLTLAHLAPTPKKRELRAAVEAEDQQISRISMIPQAITDERGRIIGKVDVSDAASREAAIEAQMAYRIRVSRDWLVAGIIDPARRQIACEHSIALPDWFNLIRDRPGIAANRRYAWSRGLSAGLHGDFLVAVSILVPQIEALIRNLIDLDGGLTDTIDEYGIQEDQKLGRLLYNPLVETILGEDVVFDLSSLLIEKTGTNLRNRFSHGLMNDGHFFNGESRYLWYIALCLALRLKRTALDGA